MKELVADIHIPWIRAYDCGFEDARRTLLADVLSFISIWSLHEILHLIPWKMTHIYEYVSAEGKAKPEKGSMRILLMQPLDSLTNIPRSSSIVENIAGDLAHGTSSRVDYAGLPPSINERFEHGPKIDFV